MKKIFFSILLVSSFTIAFSQSVQKIFFKAIKIASPDKAKKNFIFHQDIDLMNTEIVFDTGRVIIFVLQNPKNGDIKSESYSWLKKERKTISEPGIKNGKEYLREGKYYIDYSCRSHSDNKKYDMWIVYNENDKISGAELISSDNVFIFVN